MTDVLLKHTLDGGEIECVNGVLTLVPGLDTAVYLSLFGGNEDDDGSPANASRQWWGNVTEADPNKRYRSRTQYLLRSLPAIPANLRRLEEANLQDLAWMQSELNASLVSQARIPGFNRVLMRISGELGDSPFLLSLQAPWGKT